MAFNQFKGAIAASDLVSGTVAAARLPTLDSISAPTASLALNSQKITGLAAPSAATDAATKGYVDGVVEGLDAKEMVRVATTADLSMNFSSGQLTLSASSLSVDGISLALNDRILVKDQSSAEENGIYVVSNIGSVQVLLERADDASTVDELRRAYVFVFEGTANAGKGFVQNDLTSGETLNTDGVGFTQFTSQPGSVAINDLSDVSLSSLQGGEILYYNGSSSAWMAVSPASSSSGYFLQSGGSGSTPYFAQVTLSGLSDVTVSNYATQRTLIADGSSFFKSGYPLGTPQVYTSSFSSPSGMSQLHSVYVFNLGSSAGTFNLPTPGSSDVGARVILKNLGTGTITIGRAGGSSDSIDGAAADYLLDQQGEAVMAICTAANNWVLV